MELVYLWVEEYKNIQKQGFNFSSKFNCEFKAEYEKDENNNEKLQDNCELLIKPKDHIENFFGENINITAIVGENGSGKSHILNFLREPTVNNCLLIFLDDSELVVYNLFIFGNNIKLLNSTSYQLKDFIVLNYNTPSTPAFEYSHRKKYLNPLQYLYFKTYIDFNNIPNSEFGIESGRNHFLDRIYRFDYLQKLFESKKELQSTLAIREKLQLKSRDIDIKAILDNIKFDFHRTFSKYYFKLKPFLKTHFHDISFSLNFRSIEEIYRYSPYKDKIVQDEFCKKLFDEYSKTIYVEEKLFEFQKEPKLDNIKLAVLLSLLNLYVRHNEIQSFINTANINDYTKNFIEIFENRKSFSEHLQEEIIIWRDLYDLFQISEIDTKKFFEINLQLYNSIKHDIFNINFQPYLSTGQERLIYILIELYDFFTPKSNKHNSIVVLDEGESFLHPIWQKQFVLILVNFFETFFSDTHIQLILTSHSPFILSDLPKEHVVFLKKDEDGNCKNVTNETNIDTFGANIHTLLSHGFFMKDGLMGEFARDKITAIKDFYIKVQTSKSPKEEYKKEFDESIENFKNIQKIIGEQFLKTIMGNYLDELEILFYGKKEFLKNEIVRLELLQKSLND